LHKGCSYDFHYFLLLGKSIIEETQTAIPYIVPPTNLFKSLSYLLHNSMSKELFGEASKCRNKKQETRRKKKKLTRKIKREIS